MDALDEFEDVKMQNHVRHLAILRVSRRSFVIFLLAFIDG